ncbi:MAG: TadE/TadG family type IV pilus assembly protein [Alsobacter sp.]
MTSLRRILSRFDADTGGGTVVIFAMALVPLIAVMGAAIDYTAAARLHDRLQVATDATALALCKANASLTATDLQVLARDMLAAELGSTRAELDVPVIAGPPRTVALTTRSTYRTAFSGMIGVNTITLTTSAQCSAAQHWFEIALVLDTTGSMGSSDGGVTKIQSLRQAATTFVNYVYDSPALSGFSKIALVPFAAAVAVDPVTAASAPWTDGTGASSLHWANVADAAASGFSSRLSLFSRLSQTAPGWAWAGCFEAETYPRSVQDGKPDTAVADTLLVPMFAPDEAGNGGTTSHRETSSGRTQRTGNSYLDDATATAGCTTTPADDATRMRRACKYVAPAGANTGGWAGPNTMCRSRPLTRLTSSRTALSMEIAALQADGNTNIHQGVIWGWRTLSPLSVFADGVPYTQRNTTKVLVVMTDGMNVWPSASNTVLQSTYSAYGYYTNADGSKPDARLPPANAGPTSDSQARAAMDALTREACRNAATAGVLIYSVGFSTASDPIDSQGLQLLRDCAGVTERMFIATDSNALVTAFQRIAQGIGQLRLAR